MAKPGSNAAASFAKWVGALIAAVAIVAGISVGYPAFFGERSHSRLSTLIGMAGATGGPIKDGTATRLADGATLFEDLESDIRISTDEGVAYELGTKFVPKSDGVVAALSYLRMEEDADDWDRRNLTLWTAEGERLSGVQVASDIGDAGWQLALLAEPVRVIKDVLYVVSYGTEDNYVYSPGFFESAHVGAGGRLMAPSSAEVQGNGVFSYGEIGTFPTASYESTNYWVDVVFVPDPEEPSPRAARNTVDAAEVPVAAMQ